MMAKKIKVGKMLLVIFLTLLIWVWADLALDEQFTISGATITIAKSSNPRLLASFDDDQSSVELKTLVLKGPAAKIADLERKLNKGLLNFNFFLVPERFGMTEPGKHVLDVSDFCRNTALIAQLGLTVESCEPATLSVNVNELVLKSLHVRCVDKDGNLIKAATIEPPDVDMFVPPDWQGEKLIIDVPLTYAELEQAKQTPIKKTPYKELAAGRTSQAQTSVTITVSPEEDTRADYTITGAKLGITLSPITQGKYKVNVENLDAIIGAITIRATPQAADAYRQMRYQVILEIDDDDAKSANTLRTRQVIYNFPKEYLKTDEIELKTPQPVEARFRLIPLPATTGPG